MKSYFGKTALVTGASMGIGRSIAIDLAGRGARLVLVARSQDLLDQIAADLSARGSDIAVIVMDLARPGAAAELFAEVTRRGIAIDLLVNNAGFGKWGHFLEFDPATYAGMVDLNIKAVVDLCHAFLPSMAARGDCGILNVGSVASFVPVPWSTVYAATKAFILSFSEALAYEYRDRDVQITCLCPGATASNFAAIANPKAVKPEASDDSPDMVAKVGLDALLAGRWSVISGGKNQMIGILPRLLPRRTVLTVLGIAWRRILKSRGVEV